MSSSPEKNSMHNEWYTPEHIIDLVHELFRGQPDLDPASCKKANARMQAEEFFTKEHDGLLQQWYGRVFVNPPYKTVKGAPRQLDRWSKKVVEELHSGRLTEMIVLVPGRTDTGWCQRFFHHASAACFVEGRLAFIDGKTGKKPSKPNRHNAIFYYGRNVDRFARLFSEIGTVLAPIVA